jgi:hypothetical protein
MNDTAHYAEHRITRKYEGEYGGRHALTVALFIICPILILTVMLATIGFGAFFWFVPLSPTAILICKKGIYDRYFGLDYTYVVAGGTFSLSREHDGRYKREVIRFTVADAEMILPYRGNEETVNSITPDRKIKAVHTMKGDDVYAIAVNDKDGKKNLIFIDGISSTVRLFKLYNKNTVVKATKY